MLMEVTEVGIGTEVREVQVLNALETNWSCWMGTVVEIWIVMTIAVLERLTTADCKQRWWSKSC